MTSEQAVPAFREWSVLELLGHVRLAGLVSEQQLFGAKLGRIDIPGPDDIMTTQYFSAGSIYRLTPTTEEIARAMALSHQPEPVHRWELPPGRLRRRATEVEYDVSGDDDDDDEADL